MHASDNPQGIMEEEMALTIENEILRFSKLVNSLQDKGFEIKTPCPHCHIISPQTGVKTSIIAKKPVPLTLMGLTHGCEFAGVSVLNDVLTQIFEDNLALEFPVAFILGNPKAAATGKRFLEGDLNRSFSKTHCANFEEKRARELEPVLQQTRLLLDFHQTLSKSLHTFFIFPWSIGGYHFARVIEPNHPIVTHKSAFSAEGMCTDEYVNSQGGAGITIELGQNGFDPKQINTGVKAAICAIKSVTSAESSTQGATVYTWGETIPWPQDDCGPIHNVSLDEGWCNFKPITKGERIGTCNNAPIIASTSGMVLFPKYLNTKNIAKEALPAELCRIIVPASTDEFPEIS